MHMLQIRDMGLLQGQNWDLDAETLTAHCADAGRRDVLLLAAPEPIVRRHQRPVAVL